MKSDLSWNGFSLFAGSVVALWCCAAVAFDVGARPNSDKTAFFEDSDRSAKDGGAFASSPSAADPLRRDRAGVQTRYPAVAKIVGRGVAEEREDGAQTTPLYYGTGTYVGEIGDLGLVLTNWHVVSEASDSIEVLFPKFSSPAKIVLLEEVWDLAALVVRRPPNIPPVPISLEFPEIGETLWVAGYGQTNGLADFQIESGTLLNYVELFEPKGLPMETLAVGKGVRQGDSGGPIFNRYGEIAGVLWGSDGKVTMGTFCFRVQFFLTQSIRRLATMKAENDRSAESGASSDFLTWGAESFGRRAEGTTKSASVAVKEQGVYPISTRPVYSSPDGSTTAEALAALSKSEAFQRTIRAASGARALPPFPPYFSPTFVVQQREVKQTRPEIADADYYEKWIENLRVALAETRENRGERDGQKIEAPLSAVRDADSEPIPTFKEISASDVGLSDALDLALSDEKEGEAENRENDASQNASNGETSDRSKKNDSEGDRFDEKGGEAAPLEEVGASKDVRWDANRLLNLGSPSDLQIYVVICAIFCLFYNAARLLRSDVEQSAKGDRRP